MFKWISHIFNKYFHQQQPTAREWVNENICMTFSASLFYLRCTSPSLSLTPSLLPSPSTIYWIMLYYETNIEAHKSTLLLCVAHKSEHFSGKIWLNFFSAALCENSFRSAVCIYFFSCSSRCGYVCLSIHVLWVAFSELKKSFRLVNELKFNFFFICSHVRW